VIYLMLQMISALLIAALLGASLLWLTQLLWGRLVAPVRARTLEYEVEESRADLITQDQRIRSLHKELEAAREQTAVLQRAKRQLTATLDARNRALHEASTQISLLELDAHPSSRESAEDLRRELRLAVTERDEAKSALRHAETRSERQRTELEVLHGIHERMLDDLEGLKARLADAEIEIKTSGESRPPAWVMVQPYGPRDDLQRLHGVDPILERTLNRLGIYHFHQIARFETSDVEWLAEHVDGVPEQTIRDSWVADASRLSSGQHRQN
jgi:predicted flap endonuclease-1-like 5' DNA nuclease